MVTLSSMVVPLMRNEICPATISSAERLSLVAATERRNLCFFVASSTIVVILPSEFVSISRQKQ